MRTDIAPLLAAYDSQLRAEAEVQWARQWVRIGPLVVDTNASGRGFVTYAPFTGYAAEQLDALVAEVLAHLTADPEVSEIEWKTRGHDDLPGLHEGLLRHGFEPEEAESVMVGRAADLAVDVPLPEGVSLRSITDRDDVERMEEMAAEVFGRAVPGIVDELMGRLARGDGVEIWVAEAQGQTVSAGRLEPVRGTDFAGIWGGCTRPEWRGRGIYRALTAERARSALRMGKTFMNSDSTEFSRPILERSGFHKVTTTTPYVWRRADA